MAGVSVEPYREITFDADGDVNARQRERLAELDVTDLVMFAHGWNSNRSVATRMYDRFYAPFPGLLADSPGVRLGYAGIVWPSIRFADEPVPDFDRSAVPAADAGPGPGLDQHTRQALAEAFPGRGQIVERLAQLLDERPEEAAAFEEFGMLVRELAGVTTPAGITAVHASDASDASDTESEALPRMLYDDTLTVCRDFTAALAETGAAEPESESEPAAQTLSLGGGLKKFWSGAKELLRQATYYEMKRRAGTVGRLGLGPLLGQLARSSPSTRVHLVGHSQGARLVAFALRGLPGDVRNVKSVTLLQGAFSHYAFAARLPHAVRSGGALRGMERRVDGPVVACYSRHDSALGVIYPLASRLAGDSAGVVGLGAKWGAVGFDGIQAVRDTPVLTLARALRDGVPGSGCVNVDAAAVVRRGGPPSGAHSDILHAELARVVLAAGRIGG
ncbi:serine-threonine protein kinase [Streptomyces sp. ISL-96]|uniref:serine-threonine protein kinase n=1 Tax=Streptomyces sp. ISL-96 TaxID=2819191 RepID=UPI001BE71626|nr:serine-threonine protein kinase [Streptomyces sp. ISL-96]MBT2490286.1 serine-threonine protein kinase [Streptomyces sp. ISL-96]